jgi:hypothetical protein
MRTRTTCPIGKVHAWSFWDRRYLGLVDPASLRFTLAAHAPVLLRLTSPDPDRPVLVGSTLHYAQGAAEVADWRATADHLEIQLHGAGSQNGELWIAGPGRLAVTAAEGLDARLERDGSLWKVIVENRKRTKDQRIRISISSKESSNSSKTQ